jgi:hypothetical protein
MGNSPKLKKKKPKPKPVIAESKPQTIDERLAELQRMQGQALAQVHALNGAIAELERLKKNGGVPTK